MSNVDCKKLGIRLWPYIKNIPGIFLIFLLIIPSNIKKDTKEILGILTKDNKEILGILTKEN